MSYIRMTSGGKWTVEHDPEFVLATIKNAVTEYIWLTVRGLGRVAFRVDSIEAIQPVPEQA
jgi:hypothetical protein